MLSLSLRHTIARTKASRASSMALVPAPTREEAFGIVQPLESAWTNVETDVKSLAPAPTREEEFRSVQPLECAVTIIETELKLLVPAPRLELGTP